MAATSLRTGGDAGCRDRLDRPVRAPVRDSCLPFCSSSQSACLLERTAETRFPGSTRAFRIAAEKRRAGVPFALQRFIPGDTMRSMTLRACLVLASAVLSFAAAAQNISIATGGTGGVYYPLGGGIAAVLSKYVKGMQATAEVTGGSVANLELINTGKPYL